MRCHVRRTLKAGVLVLSLCGSGCPTGTATPQCTPGAAANCFCAGGIPGEQVCGGNGTFGACECGSGTAPDGGPDGGAAPDGGTPPDAGSVSCSVGDAGVAQLPAQPQAVLDRTALGFGREFGEGVFVGTTVTETVQLRNAGMAPLIVSSFSLSGDSCFSLVNTTLVVSGTGLSNTIGSGSVGLIGVSYRPTMAPSSCNGVITINSNAANAPVLTVSVSASAVTAP
jgi:hypothetical protein